MSRRPLQATLALLAVAAALGATCHTAIAGRGAPPHATRAASNLPLGLQPDIVFVIVDDLGALDGRLWQYWPALQALRDAGIDFVDFHGETPLCCPARAGFLTGQHTRNHGVVANNAVLFNPAMTLVTQLQGVGYRTVLVGKYLNAITRNHALGLKVAFPPPGWNEFTIAGHPADYYRWKLLSNSTAPQAPGVVNSGSFKPCRAPKRADHTGSANVATVCLFGYGTTPTQRSRTYSTNVLAKLGVDAIRRAPASQPLFIEIATAAPHLSPGGFDIAAAPQDATAPACAGVAGWSDPAYNEADVSDKPAYVAEAPTTTAVGYSLVATCRAMLSVDRLVDQVRAAQVARGRWDQTVLVFAGDNGMNYSDHRLGSKSAPYHTDIPFLVSSPLLAGGRVVNERVQNIDLAPTLCELAGCTLGPYPNGQLRPDGLSFTALLLGTASSLGRDAVLDDLPSSSPALNNPPWDALTTTSASPLASEGCASAGSGGCRWHSIEYATGERELYDVSGGPCWSWHDGEPGDPCELSNLLDPTTGAPHDAALQGLVDELHARLDELTHERG